MKERLTPDGLMSINVNAVSKDSKLLSAILQTLRSVFPYVTYAPTPGTYNYFIVASESPFDYTALERLPSNPYVTGLARDLAERSTSVEQIQGTILTDNRAPVELLTDAMFFTLVKESRLGEVL